MAGDTLQKQSRASRAEGQCRRSQRENCGKRISDAWQSRRQDIETMIGEKEEKKIGAPFQLRTLKRSRKLVQTRERPIG